MFLCLWRQNKPPVMWTSSQLTHSVCAGCACSSLKGWTDIPSILRRTSYLNNNYPYAEKVKFQLKKEKEKAKKKGKTPHISEQVEPTFPWGTLWHCSLLSTAAFWTEHWGTWSTGQLPETHLTCSRISGEFLKMVLGCRRLDSHLNATSICQPFSKIFSSRLQIGCYARSGAMYWW